jgi:hypothetical protein
VQTTDVFFAGSYWKGRQYWTFWVQSLTHIQIDIYGHRYTVQGMSSVASTTTIDICGILQTVFTAITTIYANNSFLR